ncbi:hypothetical protein SISNIDRAFT_448364 [Sistotremastrum niveocremeum HHB9708]|uniref:Recombination protein Rad52 n=1 Tax=Sistotremastrum niveocremeum HHB9708 TaxID=1314777 RepID=A0A164ZXG0_9AGAM|nr:hypothetical protein SISNIDRAFT_448364 [Sistotremastrum niveocremeum HHB9708]
MHGVPSTYMPSQLYAFGTPQPVKSEYMEPTISVESATKIATLQAKLDMKLGPEYISTRPGPGGGPKLSYVEGWKVINLANEVFGFNGWSSTVVNLSVDFIDGTEETKRYSVGVSAIVRVTLRDGVFHEDVGYGLLENSKSKGAALDKCRKEAITDALKRTLRTFGNVLGNCLYDKNYASEIAKVKVQPIKLDKSRLHRHPDYDDTSTAQASTSSNTSHSAPPPQQQQPPPKQNISHPKVERPEPAPHHPQNQAPTAPKSNASNPNPNPRPSAAPPAYTSRPTPPKSNPIPLAPVPQAVKAEPATSPHVGKMSVHQPDRQPPSDDNAYFHSDDDKFMAQCDFADETVPDDDLGRPIHDDLDETLVDDSSARLPSGQSPLQAHNSRTSGLSTSPVQMKASSHPVAPSSNVAASNTGFQRSSSMRNENLSRAQQGPQRQYQQSSRREMTIALIEAGQRPLQALDNNTTTRQHTSPPNQGWQKPPSKQFHAQAQPQHSTGTGQGPLGNAVSSLKRDAGAMQSGGQGQGPQRPAEITPPWVQPGPMNNVGPQVGGDGRDSKRPRR